MSAEGFSVQPCGEYITFTQHKGCFLELKGDLETAGTLYFLTLLVPCQATCNANELRCCLTGTLITGALVAESQRSRAAPIYKSWC